MTQIATAKAVTKQDALRELASRTLSKRRFMPFVQRMNPKYLPGWVHEDICRRLERFSEDVAKGLSPRLMLLMPPRHGKSELASKMFPPWHLGRYPDHEIIACSYNISLAMGFSKKIKEIIDDQAYSTVFDAQLNPNNRSTEEWTIAGHTGGYVAAGVGGGITGKGAHILIIDDPIKNAEEADSAVTRESIWDWYGSTAYTRLAPGAGVLVIQTWWHDDDLAGRIQQAMAAGKDDEDTDRFEIIKYPAIADASEFLDEATDEIVRVEMGDAARAVFAKLAKDGAALDAASRELAELAIDEAKKKGVDTSRLKYLRFQGESLHPARYDLKKLRRIKATIAPRHWSALFQQNPVPDDGAFFTRDMFRRGLLPFKKSYVVQVAFDFAIGIKKANDFTVGTASLLDEDDILHFADQIRLKSNDLDVIVPAMLDLCQKWWHPSLILGVEDGQIWKTMESTFKKACRARNFYPRIEVLPPLTDKEVRASPLRGRMQAGMVSFSATGDWYEDCRNEMLRFPAGVHDDRVDSCAWAAQVALKRTPPRALKRKHEKSWKDRLSTLTNTNAGHMAA
jgi:predicted phage terminase large subunit-like protein